MITIKQKGDFSKLSRYLKRISQIGKSDLFHKYGKMGVQALKDATPIDTGKTADSWYYQIKRSNGRTSIEFLNSNINDGVPIAVVIQFGHGTRNGGWVEGRDYINPALYPIFDKIANELWREVTTT